MRFALTIISALSMVVPSVAQADVVLVLRARIAPQCQVISVDAILGSPDVIVRTGCNVERFQLAVDTPNGAQIDSISADNANASGVGSDMLDVTVDNPGFQTLRLTLTSPVGPETPTITLQHA